MKCPKCEAENPESMKFCGECGTKLEKICPKCNSSNPPQFKFCGQCGHNLTLPSEPAPKELSFDEKLDKIQRYLPKGVTEKILARRDKIEGERKQVTVLFCDMEGFTPLVERLGAEEAYSIMDQVYEILIHKVHDYEGTVNEMTGDGIMALFGAPIALEDAPQRAIRASLAIHREMARFNDKMKEEKKDIPTLKMRIGIHTGSVVVGTLGNNLRVEFKAVGDTVNLASRMEGLAEPGTTYVSQDTFKLTEGLFRFEALGERRVKGKETLVKVYRVIAPSTRRTRFDVSAERGLTPFVGRERELELILDGFERAKAGRGQAFSIVSEAGGGKSRLLYEFRKAVADQDVTFLEGKCLSYSRGVSYHPIIDILKANFGIEESDGDLAIREKVERGLKLLGVDEASTLPYLLELLSVKESGIDKIPMSPEARKERIMEALKLIVLKGSEIRPLIMAIEDLHWIDKSSEDATRYLLQSIPGARVLLLFSYRPDFVHTWGGKSYHSQVNLNRLSNRESLAMVAHLLGTEEIDNDLENLILEKTEGIPFFVEEFVRSLQDLSLIERKENRYCLAKDVQTVTFPSTVQEVIMARVDTLPEGAKEVLQTGSVIEREFSYEMIKRVTMLPERELLSHLSALKDSELLYERGIYPETTYIFKHALTREVVYDSILTRKKKDLHERTGNAIEELYKDDISEHYGLLARHYLLSENYEKSGEFSRLAGRKAGKEGAFTEAIAFLEKGIISLKKLPRTAEIQKKLIDAGATLGMYYIQLNNFIPSKEAVEPIVELAFKSNYKRRIAQIHTIIGTYTYAIEGDYPKALTHFQEAIKVAQESNDLISFLMANHWMGHLYADNCEFEKALHHLEKALNITQAANVAWGIAAHKSCIARTVYYFQGNIELSHQGAQEGFRLAEESGDIYSKCEGYTSLGYSHFGKGDLNEAEKNLLKADDLTERINWLPLQALATSCLAEICFCSGRYQESENYYLKTISVLEQGNLAFWMKINRIGAARAKVMNKENDIDLDTLYRYSTENTIKTFDGTARRYIGEILLNIRDPRMTDAENWIRKAIDVDKRNGMRFSLGNDYALYAELFRRKGNRGKAKKNLNTAIEIYKECGADGWAEKAEKEFAVLS
ncbi:MAG: AAA family ATPase [Deltaproteobacteria bacterium]|nr:AAA family ATPase [Deltaproteobacteria bacterium]